MYDYVTAVYDYISEEVLTTYLPITLAAVLITIAIVVHSLREYRAAKFKRLHLEGNKNLSGEFRRRWIGNLEPNGTNSAKEVGKAGFWIWIVGATFVLGVVAIVYQILQAIGLVPVVSDFFN